MSNFGQGVQMITAWHDHKNQSGINPRQFLTEMTVSDQVFEGKTKYYAEFRSKIITL